MRENLRRYAVAALFAASLCGTGCTTVASTFGITPPTHKLSATASRLRTEAESPAPLPRELEKSLHPTHLLEPGDSIGVDVTEFDVPVALPVGDLRILADGTIELGRYGRPVVAGKTVMQVEAEIKKYAETITKEKDRAGLAVSVRLLGRESKVYYVLGEVSAPGAYPLIGRETVLDGIITAGGITRQASTTRVTLARPSMPDGCRFVQPVCYDAIVQLGDTSTNYQIQAGDRIYVPSKTMLEDLPFKKGKCDPCSRPHIGCTFGTCATAMPLAEPLAILEPKPAK